MRAAVVLFLLAVATPAAADFDSAAAAYRGGDFPAARAAFLELAAAGDPRAQTALAIMHQYGEGVPMDPALARAWYLRAAEQGYAPAQYNIGIMLMEGTGGPRDLEAARRWLAKAADAGFERARDRLAGIIADSALGTAADEPAAWSRRWNLRLPNDIRFDNGKATP